MKKNDEAKKERKPKIRVPRQSKSVTELTDQDLEQVQGGQGLNSPDRIFQKIKID